MAIEIFDIFEAKSVDVAIIDIPWNGAWQSYKIAAMADAHEVNVAPTTSMVIYAQ